MATQTAYIGLGSDLGDREGFIYKALEMLAQTRAVEVSRTSDLIETAPLGDNNQPDYLNAVAEIETTLSAEELHAELADIETCLGRKRGKKWSPRIIDLDLLLFGRQVINSADLVVPHRWMHLRSFVLSGLCRLNGELLHPVIKEPVNELAARLGGADFVLNPDLPQLVSVAGVIGVGKTTMVEKISSYLGTEQLFEPYDTNPFMPQVYAGKKEMALDSQLYFLTHRIEQLNRNTLKRGRVCISDYIFDKELIYAGLTLTAEQLSLYEKIYQSLVSEITRPVLVIYLTDSVQKCLERIHRRSRPYEQKIEPAFLEALSSDYKRLFADWKTCPLIRISMSKTDYTGSANIEHLANQVKSYVAI